MDLLIELPEKCLLALDFPEVYTILVWQALKDILSDLLLIQQGLADVDSVHLHLFHELVDGNEVIAILNQQ